MMCRAFMRFPKPSPGRLDTYIPGQSHFQPDCVALGQREDGSAPYRRDEHLWAGFDHVSSHRNGLGNGASLAGVRNRSLHPWNLLSEEEMQNIVAVCDEFAFLNQMAAKLSFPAAASSATNPQKPPASMLALELLTTSPTAEYFGHFYQAR